MNFILYNLYAPVAFINMEIRLTGPVVYSIKMLEYGKLPYEIRQMQSVQINPESATELWLKKRTIPNDRKNLDWFLYNYLKLPTHLVGAVP